MDENIFAPNPKVFPFSADKIINKHIPHKIGESQKGKTHEKSI